MFAILCLLCLLIFPISVQEETPPVTFVDHTGTFQFEYPQGWQVSDLFTGYEVSSSHVTDLTELQAGDYVVIVQILTEPTLARATLENVRAHTQSDATLEDLDLGGRSAVMLSGVNYDREMPVAQVSIIVGAEDEFQVQVGGFGIVEELPLLEKYAIDIAMSARQIDPEILEIDTANLTETYIGEDLQFNYPANTRVHETDSLVIVDSMDFSESVIYDGVIYNDFDLPQINEVGIEDQYRIAFHLRSRAELETFQSNFDFNEHDFYQWIHGDAVPPESVYRSELNGRPVLWMETPGVYMHDIYFPNMFKLIYALDSETYVLVEAHSYGFYLMYPTRELLMNMLATVERVDPD